MQIPGAYPTLRTWMLFVDGENLTIRAQELAKQSQYNVTLEEGKYYKRDVFIWIPNRQAQLRMGSGQPELEQFATRASYYTSLKGDYSAIDSTRDNLRALGFSSDVFKRTRENVKAKGVDIALTKD